MSLCCVHLPGNRQCPYPALYLITWIHHAPRPEKFARLTCLNHVVRAIDDAIGDTGKRAEVTVSFAPDGPCVDCATKTSEP